MDKWKTVRLDEVCSLITDGTHQTPEYCLDNGIPFMSSKDVTTEVIDWSNLKQIPKELHEKLHKRLAPMVDDILLAKNGTTGIAAIVDKECVFDIYVSLALLRPLGCILPKYLLKVINSPLARDQFKKHLKGIGVPNLHLSEIRNTEIPLPPLPIQRKIADALDKSSALIEMRKAQIEKLDLLIKSQFIEMFGDPVTNPKGWETKLLGDIALVGSSKRVFVEELVEHGIPFYRGTEIGSLAEGKNIVPTLFISPEHYSDLKKATGVPDIGDLLLPSICPDGRIWSVNTSDPFYFKDGRVLWIHFVKKNFDHNYLLYAIKERIISDYNNIASGTTFAELKIFSLKKLRVLLPPREKQEQFAEVIRSITKLKQDLEISNNSFEQNYQSLMQKCFSGEMF